ncbi:zinc finger protein 583-like isoform X2 [Gadus chalcogrammus]|uniref:zinc finger protein 583-like isoform X2 n=1 Tax=Gadus chalcogrammus TaxID=1042646 RepID=UPI0024C21E6F|nr:zinc finger protein 583-like isoform X2 [Gadus chalcogrammus]
MLINMSPCGSTMEEQLSSIMDVLAKAAVSEISQLFSEGSATLQLQITRSREENEALRTRMKEMRSELFSLRLQTRSKASGAASRFALARDNIGKPRTTSQGNESSSSGLKPLIYHKAVGHSPFHSPSKSVESSVTSPAEGTPGIILIKIEEDISGCRPAEDCNAYGGRSMQSAAASEFLHVVAPSSSHVSSQNAELRILSVRGLAVEGHETLFNVSELEALNSLSADCSVAKSLDCGERLDCRKELAVQETPDNILIKVEEDIGGSIPPVEDCNDIRDCSTQPGATSDSLHPDAPGSSHMSSHKFSRVHSLEKPYRCDQCMKGFKRSYDLKIHMRIHSGERPYKCEQCMKRFSQSYNLKIHMRIHSREKPYRCEQCMKRFSQSYHLKIHMRIHSGEKPCVCLQCKASFSDPRHLREHMINAHGHWGELTRVNGTL